MSQNQRSDARSNRERVLAAARETFADAGLDAPMREIARRAGIGVATLYRHFPSRTELITAVLAERVEACNQQVRAALDDPDPWRALAGTILTFADRQIHDRALNEALLGSGDAFPKERQEHSEALNILVSRARSAGVLREGVDADDVRAGLLALASLHRLPAPGGARIIGKLAALVLAGLRAPAVPA
ncbi:AcrR family transcriptional regulator [Actinoplanes lutulentus]|uniref:TetR family transcriptional regulator n=1 Tax=Actinoplanes lutulentus TaxID=1287878 RepID=A0A327Z652_9ACTN|nr:TetR/AcrR family transcriptional regulator [Actinoplanes lutulentus]MBB2948814.1 AcrR family transcriptional regulator [Actinoplanes lutulentus]RAK29726.1 TetR family transcriptional regulator [Actinoplanes lutulentus]